VPELVVDLGSVALPRFYEEPNGHWGVHLRYGYGVPGVSTPLNCTQPASTR